MKKTGDFQAFFSMGGVLGFFFISCWWSDGPGGSGDNLRLVGVFLGSFSGVLVLVFLGEVLFSGGVRVFGFRGSFLLFGGCFCWVCFRVAGGRALARLSGGRCSLGRSSQSV